MTSMPPKASAEQLETARANSIKTRLARAELRKQIAGSADPRKTLRSCLERTEARGMSLLALLTALPSVGPRRAGNIMDKAGIPRKNTVQRCGPKQLERLFEIL